MAISSADRQRLHNMIDSMDDGQLKVIAASVDAFAAWLKSRARDIYDRVSSALNNLWAMIRNWWDG